MYKEISILGCGWLGLPLAVRLIGKGFLVKGSTTSPEKIDQLESLHVEPFLINLSKIENNITDFLASHILIISIPSKVVDDFINLIPFIQDSRIKQVLFISSTSVYANSNSEIKEDGKLRESPLTKIEELFRKNREFKSTIIRFGGLFGYDRKPGNFIPQNRKMENPDGFINLIHRDDCIGIIESIIEKDIWGETFNACADTHPGRREFYRKEALKLGKEPPVFKENSSNEYKLISSEKLKSILNYTFKFSNLMDD